MPKKENIYEIPASWSVGSNIRVVAGTLDEAISIVEKSNKLPEEFDYIDGSFLVDRDTSIEMNQPDIVRKRNISIGRKNNIDPKNEDIELSDEQIERNDQIDNAVFDCIKILTENDSIEWDMEIIGETTDAIKEVLHGHGIHVRHPGVTETPDGKFIIEE